MNKKGFTLIELLAVIVILAIIALIATPVVLKIIEDSKLSAAKDSAMVISKAAETHYMSNVTLQGEPVSTIDLTGDTIQYKGEKPDKGYVSFDDKGNAYLKMYKDGYCIVSDYDNIVVADKMDSDECDTSLPIVYIEMEEKYYDPTGQNPNCTEATAGSASGTKSGCMRWYAYAEQGSNYLMVLDHDVSETYTTYQQTLDLLETTRNEWVDANVQEVRLMRAFEANEVVKFYAPRIPGYDLTRANSWNEESGTINYYYFATGTTTYMETTEILPFWWLFDRTHNCTDYGCKTADGSATWGYWTSTPNGNGNKWIITYSGHSSTGEINPSNFGFRPVIEVSKSAFTN